MNSNQVDQRYREGAIRVAEIRKPLVEGQLHPQYKIEEKSAKRTPTDRFQIFALLPIDGDPALPTFVARWDEPAMTVDIDMHIGDQTRKDFEGHHRERRNWGEA